MSPVGPIEPATNISRPDLLTTSLASFEAARDNSYARSSELCNLSLDALPPNEFVRNISHPASTDP